MQAFKNTLWNLLIITLAGILAFLLYKRGKLDPYLPDEYASTKILAPQTEAPPEPAPANAEVKPATAANPAPQTSSAPAVAQTREAAPPAAVQTVSQTAPPPAAQDQPIALSALAPRHLPREVKLLRPTVFPVIFNGRTAGSFSAPAGVLVKVVRVGNDRLTVQNGDAVIELAAADTDIYQRVQALMRR